MKKRKLSENPTENPTIKRKKSKKDTQTASTVNATAEFPNGWFYCHQCAKKRDKIFELRCTSKEQKRCASRYCKVCLKNRYGEDANTIKNRGLPQDNHDRVGHTTEDGYVWTCPKCKGNCNCCRCRKAQGLEPTGNLTIAARKVGDSAAALLAQNPNAIGVLPGKGQQVIQERKVSKEKSRDVGLIGEKEGVAKKVRAPRKKAQVPEPIWEEVPTDLDRGEAEDRFFLREFIIRFAPLMDIKGKNLEDLDEFDSLSDACAKSLILNLLGLIAADAEENVRSALKRTIRSISASGMHPNALWANVSELRSIVPTSVLRIPDPSPPTAGTHRTRNSSNVNQAAQLVPILVALIEAAIQGASVRNEIENGAKDMKEANKVYYATAREENERWAIEKQTRLDEKAENESKEGWDAEKWASDYKAGNTQHKVTLEDLDQAHNQKVQAYIPRFQPLGQDQQGRIYYASTALPPKKLPTAEEQSSLRKWSWFLAVWGPGGQPKDREEENIEKNDDGSEEEDHCDRWWGFSEPQEIKKLAKWIEVNAHSAQETSPDHIDVGRDTARQAGIASTPLSDLSDVDNDEGENGTRHGTKAGRTAKNDIKYLVKGLNEYSDFLAWRINDGKVDVQKGRR